MPDAGGGLISHEAMDIADDFELTIADRDSDALLERNLAQVRRLDPGLADRIAAAPREPLEVDRAEDGHGTAVWRGRRLASARRPGAEAARLLEGLDLHEVGLVGIVGFGLGHHVAAMARRLREAGVVLVLETDLALLRAVLSRIDATGWLAGDTVRIVDRPSEVEVAHRVRGLDSLLMIGIRLLEHPPSAARLGDEAGVFAGAVREAARNARMNISTALARSASTLENELGNLPAYVSCGGVEDLRDIAKGRLGVVVSAGPSLRRNIELLARPGRRDRCLIVATQTTLRPLLAAGVAPHYVTAIDYHAISRRFYEGLTADMVRDTELVVDPRVNPAVIEAWPGRLRLNPAASLDRLLGPLGRGTPGLPLSATVAHLCHSLARHLGCDPVALVGQDLGFTDGLYYAPGNAIHDLWTPEFNAFNTIETMEWERIARHRRMLAERRDVHGRRIFTDAQMQAYLQRFEFMFADDAGRGLTTIDATEGGVRKEGAESVPLAEVLDRHAGPDVAALTLPRAPSSDPDRQRAAVARVRQVLDEVREVGAASREAGRILEQMRNDQADRRRMDRHFDDLERHRRAVADRSEAFQLIDTINQIAVFKRARADRSIHLDRDLDPLERQRREIDRDLVNVEWTGDASDLLADMLDRTAEHLETGRRREPGRTAADLERTAGIGPERGDDGRVFAVVPLDPERGGTGAVRRLDAPFLEAPLLPRVLERIGTSEELSGIILLAPDHLDVEALFDRARIPLPIIVHRCGDAVFPPSHEMIRKVRSMTPTSWRGGPMGLSVHDEILVPGHTRAALEAVQGDAVVPIGPDWPVVTVRGEHGVDELVRRWRDRTSRSLVFVQAPPGLGTVLVARDILEGFDRMPTRRATIGHLLGYRPELPQSDPITDEACVIPSATVRDGLGRFTADSSRQRGRLRRAVEEPLAAASVEPAVEELVVRLESRMSGVPLMAPQFTRIELCTGRKGVSRSMPFAGEVQRPPMDESTFRRVVEPLGETGDAVIVLDGFGDPLSHPRFDDFIRIAAEAGVRTIGVRTDLMVEPEVIDRLLAVPVDVVEVDLDAETADTHARMHAAGRFDQVIANLQRLVAGRRLLATATPMPAEVPAELRPGLPVVVPRMQRCVETIDELPEFFERWRSILGCAVIDGPVRWDPELSPEVDPLSPTQPPARADRLVATTRMTVLSDGSVPVRETDPFAADVVGRVGDRPLRELWREVVERRREHEIEEGSPPPPMRA